MFFLAWCTGIYQVLNNHTQHTTCRYLVWVGNTTVPRLLIAPMLFVVWWAFYRQNMDSISECRGKDVSGWRYSQFCIGSSVCAMEIVGVPQVCINMYVQVFDRYFNQGFRLIATVKWLRDMSFVALTCLSPMYHQASGPSPLVKGTNLKKKIAQVNSLALLAVYPGHGLTLPPMFMRN